MSRPIRFALECVAGLMIAVLGAWLAAWMGGRINDKVNRQAYAAERVAAALERAYPAPKALPRPSLLDDVRLGDGTTCSRLECGKQKFTCSGEMAALGAVELPDDCGP